MKLGITMLIHYKDDIQFVTEFPCLLGHPVYPRIYWTSEIYAWSKPESSCLHF